MELICNRHLLNKTFLFTVNRVFINPTPSTHLSMCNYISQNGFEFLANVSVQ